jgi:hypothetical protein
MEKMKTERREELAGKVALFIARLWEEGLGVTQLPERRHFCSLAPKLSEYCTPTETSCGFCFGGERFGNSRVKKDGFAVGSISAGTVFIVRDGFGDLYGISIRW